MGYYSFRCAKTGEPILAGAHGYPADLQRYARVIELRENEPPRRGEYDGYGRVDDQPIEDTGRAKLVLEHHWAGERWSDLPFSKNCPHQGCWDEDDLRDVLAGRMPYLGFYDPIPDSAHGVMTLERERAERRAFLASRAGESTSPLGRYAAEGRVLSAGHRAAALHALRDEIADLDAADDAAGGEMLRRLRGDLKRAPLLPDPGAQSALPLRAMLDGGFAVVVEAIGDETLALQAYGVDGELLGSDWLDAEPAGMAVAAAPALLASPGIAGVRIPTCGADALLSVGAGAVHLELLCGTAAWRQPARVALSQSPERVTTG